MLTSVNDDFELILTALRNPPSLIIDAANKANPHRFYAHVPYENYRQVYVVSVDAIYRFRDTLKAAARIAKSVGAKRIIITSYDYLFNYQDDVENADVIEHCHELMNALAGEFEVYANPRKGFVPCF